MNQMVSVLLAALQAHLDSVVKVDSDGDGKISLRIEIDLNEVALDAFETLTLLSPSPEVQK